MNISCQILILHILWILGGSDTHLDHCHLYVEYEKPAHWDWDVKSVFICCLFSVEQADTSKTESAACPSWSILPSLLHFCSLVMAFWDIFLNFFSNWQIKPPKWIINQLTRVRNEPWPCLCSWFNRKKAVKYFFFLQTFWVRSVYRRIRAVHMSRFFLAVH